MFSTDQQSTTNTDLSSSEASTSVPSNEHWENPLGDLQTVLSTLNVPDLPDLFAALDVNALVERAAALRVETIQPFETTAQTDRRAWCVPAFEPRWMSRRPVSAQTDCESLALMLDWLERGDDSVKRDKLTRIRNVDAEFFDGLALGITKKTLTKLKV